MPSIKLSTLATIVDGMSTHPTIEEIKILASKFPYSLEEVAIKADGQEMLDKNYVAPEDRKHIDPKAQYTVITYAIIPHYKNLREAYKRNGKAGIQNYARWFFRHHIQFMEKNKNNPHVKMHYTKLTIQQ